MTKDSSLYLAMVASFCCLCLGSFSYLLEDAYFYQPLYRGRSSRAGLAIHAPVKWKVLLDIFICWIFTPIGAAILGYIFYQIFKNMFYRIIPRKYLKITFAILIIISGCYVAYSWGANDVANAMGVIVGAGIVSPHMSVILGGLAIVLGIMTWGYKVIETIGSEITHLLPIMAFSAQLASAINVHIYTVFGIPVSTSHSIVGAIFGVGLVRGMRVLNLRIMREIIICWLATPFISGIISFLVLKGIMLFVKIRRLR